MYSDYCARNVWNMNLGLIKNLAIQHDTSNKGTVMYMK